MDAATLARACSTASWTAPIAAVASANGLRGVNRAVEMMMQGADTLDAGVEGVKGIHDLHVWTIASGLVAMSGHVEIAVETRDAREGLEAFLAKRQPKWEHR